MKITKDPRRPDYMFSTRETSVRAEAFMKSLAEVKARRRASTPQIQAAIRALDDAGCAGVAWLCDLDGANLSPEAELDVVRSMVTAALRA